MKITVINGTEKHGVTYHLKEIFLEQFREKSDIREFYLPKDCPAFCSGCANCIIKGEDTCKDAEYIQKIVSSLLESDLIIMTSPAYVMHATGSMKALLDHLAYLWMPHRPDPEMFTKRAVIITQCHRAEYIFLFLDKSHKIEYYKLQSGKHYILFIKERQITMATIDLIGNIVKEGKMPKSITNKDGYI